MLQLPGFLFPELAHLPKTEHRDVLRRAAETPFDVVELLGIAAGLVAVAALTRYGVVGLSIAERIGMAAANFAIAVPLLVVAVAPFHLRRMKRGVRDALRDRSGAT
jgi:hypothetical protein